MACWNVSSNAIFDLPNNWPARSKLITFGRYHTSILFLWQIDESQLHHAEKVVARETILVEHLKHQLVLARLHAEDEFFIPQRV